MRKFAIVVLSTLMGLALGSNALAQGTSTPGTSTPGTQPKVSKVDRLAKALNLTDQQKQQVQDILTKAKADAANASDKQAKHAIFKTAWQNIRTNVLTDQQRTQLAQMHRGHHMRHHMMGVLKKLNLTADQKAQVKTILQQARADAANATDMQAKKQIHQQAWQKVRTQVLTDAQRRQLDQMKAQWKAKHAPATTPS